MSLIHAIKNNRFVFVIFFLMAVSLGLFSSAFLRLEYGKIVYKPFLSKAQGKEIMETIEQEQDERKQFELMRDLAMRAGPEMAVELLNESRLPKSGQTHLIAHIIGQVAYQMYKEKSLPVCGDDMLNGCAHGLIMVALPHIGIQGIQQMIDYCKTLTPFKYHMCLHASGHAFLAVTDYKDLLSALNHCDSLVDPSDSLSIHCYNGVFMENAHGEHDGIIPSLHPWLDANNLMRPCDEVAHRYKTACYLNQAGWWYLTLGGDIGKGVALCGRVPTEYQMACANNIGRVISTAVRNNIDEIRKNCALLSTIQLHEECINAIGQSVFVLGDSALPLEICKMIQSDQGKSACYRQLVASFAENRIPRAKIMEFCGQFEQSYQSFCHVL